MLVQVRHLPGPQHAPPEKALAATDAYRESMGALAQECFVGAPEVVEHSFAGAFFPDGGAPT